MCVRVLVCVQRVCKSCGAFVLVVKHCVRIHFLSVAFFPLPFFPFLSYHLPSRSSSQHIVICSSCTASKKGLNLPRLSLSLSLSYQAYSGPPPFLSTTPLVTAELRPLCFAFSLALIALIPHPDNIVIWIHFRAVVWIQHNIPDLVLSTQKGGFTCDSSQPQVQLKVYPLSSSQVISIKQHQHQSTEACIHQQASCGFSHPFLY